MFSNVTFSPDLPIPKDTYAYGRAIREKLCAELSAAAYDRTPASKSFYEEFLYPSRSSVAATLRAFAYLEDGVGYLSFRGTDNLRNWLSDFHITPAGLPKRHRGFDNCCRRLLPKIQEWLIRSEPQELIITGHSLGGAMAQIAAFDLRSQWRIRAVVCFGAPLVGWRQFAETYDASSLRGQPDNTLGGITTTYVFKSDLVRTLLLPRLCYKPVGQVIMIDERGQQSDGFNPWYEDAISETVSTFDGSSDLNSMALVSCRTLSGNPALISRETPRLSVRSVIEVVQPFVKPVAVALPQVQAILLAAGTLMTAYLSARYLKRDASYHSAKDRYARAMTARVERWNPLAYQERAQVLQASGDFAPAIPYWTAALEGAEREARSAGSHSPLVQQLTWRPRVNRAEAFIGQRNYAAAIADLSTLIESYGKAGVIVPASSEGRFSVTPQLLALQVRARAYRLNGQLSEAMADWATVLTADPDLSPEAFFAILKSARRSLRVGNLVMAAFDYKAREVKAETDRLLDLRKQQFNRGMAALWADAHYQRAVCAVELGDYPTAIADATGAIELDSADAWAFHLRGVAHARLKHRDDAIRDFNRSVELQPQIAGFYFARGYSRLMFDSKLGPVENGLASLTAVLQTSEMEQIEQDFRKTLELEPSHANARAFLASIRAGLT